MLIFRASSHLSLEKVSNKLLTNNSLQRPASRLGNRFGAGSRQVQPPGLDGAPQGPAGLQGSVRSLRLRRTRGRCSRFFRLVHGVEEMEEWSVAVVEKGDEQIQMECQ